MAYVITFEDVTPSARVDNVAWTTIEIREASARDGVYVTIDTLALSPLDPDPAHPLARSFTTSKATMPSGWYIAAFLDAAQNEQLVGPFRHDAHRTSYTPGVGDVGALLRARTLDTSGNELGTFTATTRPTGEQVERLINQAARKVTGTAGVGSDLPEALWEDAAGAITLRAAMLVELSYFPEQVRAATSPYTELTALFDEAVHDLVVARIALGADDEIGTSDDLAAGRPYYREDTLAPAVHVRGSELPTGITTWMEW